MNLFIHGDAFSNLLKPRILRAIEEQKLDTFVIANKKIILLDEPTASMDENTEKQIIFMLKNKLTPNQTMIVVTHKPIVLNMVDRIIVLSPKGIVMDGSKEEILQRLALPKNIIMKV